MAAVEQFRDDDHANEYRLRPEQIEDLLATSWLAPISTTSPLLHMCTAEEAQTFANDPPVGRLIVLRPATTLEEPSKSRVNESPDVEQPRQADSANLTAAQQQEPALQSATSNQTADDPYQDGQGEANEQGRANSHGGDEGNSNNRGDRRRRRRKHTIHRRLRCRLKRRRDRPILEVPWKSYYEAVKELETA